jgi:peptidoglycan hydrolase-like protein with peptidoglycan-binding domain
MTRARALFTAGAIALAAGTVAIAGVLWLQPAPPAAQLSTLAMATAEITRGALRDTRTVTGTLSYGELDTLRPGLDAASMVTWMAPIGATVERGQPIYRLSGQPTILFYGLTPQSRTLRFDPNAETPVWVELEQARNMAEAAELTLRLERERLADAEARLADTTLRLDDSLSPAPATAEAIQLVGAVSAAQAKLARVRELAAAQLTPHVDIAAAESELAVARAGFDGAVRMLRKDQAAARLDAATARVAIAEATMKLNERQGALAALDARGADDADVRQISDNLAALGYDGANADQIRAWQRDAGLPITGIVGTGQIMVVPGPVHIADHKASIGETVSASSVDGSAILDYSSTAKRVTVPLSVAEQRLAAVGRPVGITLPDDREIDGAITEVGSVVTDGTIEVTIAIADQSALAGLEVASVDVEFVSESRDDVLSAPVAALLARPEGGFAVEVVGDGASHLAAIETGLFAAGRVEISGEGIAEGVRVSVPK